VLRVSMLVMYLCVRGHVFVCWMSCISVLWISMLPLSTILIFHCVIVTTVWYSIAKKSQFIYPNLICYEMKLPWCAEECNIVT
jgi:hypothetical protein